MKYKFLLFDADNTVLDFDKSEEQALRIALGSAGIDFNQEVLKTYVKNNLFMWEKLERGEVTKEQVLIGRFILTAEELGWKCDVNAVAKQYEMKLHEGYFVIDHAREVLQQLIDNGHKLYLVSNGVLSIQNARMKGSGMEKYFIQRFISEQIGYPKPQKKFFDYCFEHIDGFEKSQALIIGDSLTSDMQGGVNAGIDTCWYNIHNINNNSGLKLNYTIYDLRELYDIVK